ncbi:hypothetical protein ABZT17_26785 [Streptomyces sp. NPDC005648]|uniref:hypothetical protein n=1 Tax=Streptomyces sp. NPDC005648 TaxID=3157044 RepID=UPI0033B4CCA9
MTAEQRRDAVMSAMKARGLRPIKSEDWDRDVVLQVLRENRARNAGSPYTQEVIRTAAVVANEISGLVDLPVADIATVLLAAGASVGTVALLRPVTGRTTAEILQFAAMELDQHANGGETP